MADKFDSGHVIVPVLHPESGEIHDIAVPQNTPLSDLHDALASDYHLPQPSAEGTVENSDYFRKAAGDIWKQVGEGGSPWIEAGASIGRNGKAGPVHVKVSPPNSIPNDSITYQPSDVGTIHSHPDKFSSEPSPQDIQAAKQSRKNVWLVSKGGLYSVTPNGQVTHVYSKSDWMKSKN